GQAYQHLGVPTGFRVDANPRAAAERVEDEAQKPPDLTPWQKLHAIRTFILPQLDFALLTARVQKTAFQNLSTFIKEGVKRTLFLPQRATPREKFA
ncbi:hypothetical protein FOCC_FOCC013131, partial [Frankliniella occidentalis]